MGYQPPSLEEIQKCPVYFRRDVKTTNPRKLFRYLINSLSEMGYLIVYDTVNVLKDEIGDTGAVDANIIAKKEYKAIIKLKKRHPIATPIAIILGVIGLFLLYNPTMIIFGLIMIAGAIYIFMKFKVFEKKELSFLTLIYIKGIGEAYRGKYTENIMKKEIEREQIITEMTLHLAGEAIPDIKDVTKKLMKDMTSLLEKIDSFIE